MTHYKIYDRQTLKLVDAGIAKSYDIDFDYMANNGSSLCITRESKGFKGDLLAIAEDARLIALGCITAIDNGDLRISFKHPKELFNDSVLNVFYFTSLLNKKFEAVSALQTILNLAFVTAVDPHRRLPLEIRTRGTYSGAVWTDDSPSINLIDFIDFLFDHYNIYLDFQLDFIYDKIICTIIHNDSGGKVLKDNIKLSKPELDKDELPKENVAVLFNKGTGVIRRTYYLLQNNTLSTNANHALRVLPPAARYVEWDDVEAIREGYTMYELAFSEIGGNIYEHFIEYKLAKKQTMVTPEHFNIGDAVTIVYSDGRQYDSIYTGLKTKMGSPFTVLLFGKIRADFSDRMKLSNKRRFAKKI